MILKKDEILEEFNLKKKVNYKKKKKQFQFQIKEEKNINYQMFKIL